MGPEIEKQERGFGSTLSDVVASIAAQHNVEPDALFGRLRHQQICAARHAVWRALHVAGWSYPRIGKAFGRDHATVMNGCKRGRK